ncbi:MAG: YciC family protein [Candidatus Parvarchaeum sp.]
MAFDVLSVFKKSFVLLFTDPLLFAFALVYAAIYIAFSVSLYSIKITNVSSVSITPINIVYLSIYAVLIFLAITFISGMAFVRIAGKKKSISKIINKTMKRYPALLATTFLTSIIIALGFIAFIIPGIYLMFKLILSPVSSVVEDKSPTDAIKRSWNITFGNWWYLFALFVIFFIVLSIIGLLPYISSFFYFVSIISYPLVFMALTGKSKSNRKKSHH